MGRNDKRRTIKKGRREITYILRKKFVPKGSEKK